MKKFYDKYIPQLKKEKKSKADALVGYIIESIDSSIIMVGVEVPEQRGFAKDLGIGVSCVSRALVKLKDIGYIIPSSENNRSCFTDRLSSFSSSPSTFGKKAHPTFMSKVKKIFPWKSKKYLEIGRTAINPSLVVQAKPNPIQKIIEEIFRHGVYFWNTYKGNNLKFIKHALFEVISKGHLNINIDQIALGVSRGSVLNDLFNVFIEPGEGVFMNSKTDRQVIEKLETHGAHLFFSKEDHGICLKELQEAVERQANTENPIEYVFVNPFLDNYSNDQNIYQNIYNLIWKTEELRICMILDFSEDAFLDQPIDFLFGNKLEDLNHLLYIKKFSILAAEMNEIQLVIGSTDLISRYERMKFNKVYNKGLSFFIMEEIKGKLIVENFLPDIIKSLGKWRKEVRLSAKLLSPWFTVKKANKGTSIWLVSNNGEELMIPMHLLLELDIAMTHSWEDYEDEFPISAIRVGFGYGETIQIEKAFKIIRDYLLVHYPIS